MKRRSSKGVNIYKYLFYSLIVVNLCILGYVLYVNPNLRGYFSEKIQDVIGFKDAPDGNFLYGIDVSEYQGVINWNQLEDLENGEKTSFVIIRSTAGINHRDRYFTSNWREAKKKGIIRGAYHYYRPNENGSQQAEFFIKNVKLSPGDLPPIIDIEKLSDIQSVNSLIEGVSTWINKVEEHYGVQPIIYSGAYFYKKYLIGKFSKNILWVANYNKIKNPLVEFPWSFWQYTDKGNIIGIKGPVDMNVFKGDEVNLIKLLLK